jgi:hypothetical protein
LLFHVAGLSGFEDFCAFDEVMFPEAYPTTAIYNASAVKNYSAASSLVQYAFPDQPTNIHTGYNMYWQALCGYVNMKKPFSNVA